MTMRETLSCAYHNQYSTVVTAVCIELVKGGHEREYGIRKFLTYGIVLMLTIAEMHRGYNHEWRESKTVL